MFQAASAREDRARTAEEKIDELRDPQVRQELDAAKDVVAAARARSQQKIEVVLPPTERPSEPFISACAFEGRRAGYVYKTGESGLGYYLDAAPPAPPPPKPRPRPTSGPLSDGPTSGPLSERWTFEQTPTEAALILRGLPPGTKAKDVKLKSAAKTLSLSVGSEVVLDAAKLHLPCVPDESEFQLHAAPDGQSRTLSVSLTKLRLPNAPPWPSLLETVQLE